METSLNWFSSAGFSTKNQNKNFQFHVRQQKQGDETKRSFVKSSRAAGSGDNSLLISRNHVPFCVTSSHGLLYAQSLKSTARFRPVLDVFLEAEKKKKKKEKLLNYQHYGTIKNRCVFCQWHAYHSCTVLVCRWDHRVVTGPKQMETNRCNM